MTGRTERTDLFWEIHMSKISRLFNWGVGAFQIVMKNKIVSTGCFLIPGITHLFRPVGSLDWDTMMLSLLLLLYSVVSIIFVLTNKNELVGKGRELAGGFVKGYFEGQRDNASIGQELLAKDSVIGEHMKESNKRLDKRVEKLTEKQKNTGTLGKTALLIFYTLLLLLAICMFLWRSIFVNIVQVIFGALLIADGISSVITVRAAYKSNAPVKNNTVLLIMGIFTIVLGIVFVFLPANSAALVYQIIGALLILKAIGEFVVVIRNRELLASVKETIHQIKEQ